MSQMEKDILREKQNIFYCMNPAVSVDQERALYEEMDNKEDTKSKYFEMMKTMKEATIMAPRPLSNHYDILKTTGTWQKF